MQKEKVLAVLEDLPDEADVDALTERLYLLQKIDEATSRTRRLVSVPTGRQPAPGPFAVVHFYR